MTLNLDPDRDQPLTDLLLSRQDLDRHAQERAEHGLLQRVLADPETVVVDVRAGLMELDGDRLVRRAPSPSDLEELLDPGSLVHVFLGRDVAGAAYVARLEPDAEGATGTGLRDAFTRLDARDSGIFTVALGLSNWHGAHPRCPRCGEPTVAALAGWVRRCPADGSEHYPRTDPAIIVAVTDDADRILLGHNRGWPDGRFSTLAGFVEPGESLEDAVRREVAEESGVRVGEVTYLGSQPWPFPASLMLGCRARAVSTEITVDDEEVTEARWFTRDELVDDLTSGRVVGPGAYSIAHRLLAHWLGGPVPSGHERF